MVASETEPFTQPVPVPVASITCSTECRTAPVNASTSTVRRLGPSETVPRKVGSQARRAAPVSAE